MVLSLGEDSYLQVRKGAVLLVSKHATICCEVLNAQLVGKQERWPQRIGPRQGADAFPVHLQGQQNLIQSQIWSGQRVSKDGFGSGG